MAAHIVHFCHQDVDVEEEDMPPKPHRVGSGRTLIRSLSRLNNLGSNSEVSTLLLCFIYSKSNLVAITVGTCKECCEVKHAQERE